MVLYNSGSFLIATLNKSKIFIIINQLKFRVMKTAYKESTGDLLELIGKMQYFTKLKPNNENDNSFSVSLKMSSYHELNLMISGLLKTSIDRLKNDATETGTEVLLLLETVLELLPEDEMELLDELHRIYFKV